MKTCFCKKLNVILLLAVLTLCTVFAVGCNNQDERPQNPYATKNNFDVSVTDCEEAIEFAPEGFNPAFGLVFFTGAFVSPENYDYLARALAKQGYLVVLSKVEYPQAHSNYNPNIPALLKYPNVKFFIGGHDVGGGAAVRHAMDYAANGYNVVGTVLYAPSYFKMQKFENGQLVKDEDGNPVWDHFTISDRAIPSLLLETDDTLRTNELKLEAQQHINGNLTTLTTLDNSSSLAFSTISSTLLNDENAIAQRSNTIEQTLDFMLKIIKSLGIYRD